MTQRLRLTLGAWRQLAGKLDVRRAHSSSLARIPYWLSGAGYSLLTRIQDASHADGLKTAKLSPPIFLLGFWRSGTTFLHELFCCDHRFGFPSTYACLNPSHFLLSEAHLQALSQQQARRPMDNMLYSWGSPQEDEFALLCLGAPSPYEALIAPSLMRDARLLLDLRSRSRQEQERWADVLQHFLRLLTIQQGKTMVLKSPTHGFRLPLLASLFPGARFVIIERNPYEVFASNLKLWPTLFGMYALESFSLDEIEAFILAAYVIHEEAIAEGEPSVPPRSLARVRYEDLVANPIGEMERLYGQTGLDEFETVRPKLEQHVASVSNHKRNRFRLSREQRAHVDAAWGTKIKERGYAWPDGYIEIADSVVTAGNSN